MNLLLSWIAIIFFIFYLNFSKNDIKSNISAFGYFYKASNFWLSHFFPSNIWLLTLNFQLLATFQLQSSVICSLIVENTFHEILLFSSVWDQEIDFVKQMKGAWMIFSVIPAVLAKNNQIIMTTFTQKLFLQFIYLLRYFNKIWKTFSLFRQFSGMKLM